MHEAIRVCIKKKKNHFSNLNNNLNLREQGHDHRRDIHHIPSDGMARATQLRRLEQPGGLSSPARLKFRGIGGDRWDLAQWSGARIWPASPTRPGSRMVDFSLEVAPFSPGVTGFGQKSVPKATFKTWAHPPT